VLHIATWPVRPGQSIAIQQAPPPMHAPPHGLLSPAHMYWHMPVPVSHLPSFPAAIGQSASLQQFPWGMQVPLQSLDPETHEVLHLCVARSQVAT
jgi:hypothetical protein